MTTKAMASAMLVLPRPLPPVMTVGLPNTRFVGSHIIRHARINKGMNSSSTQLKLESSQGDKLEAFVRGEHPELAVGVVLANAKLEKRQKDTVVYYMLEEFKIAETQPQALACPAGPSPPPSVSAWGRRPPAGAGVRFSLPNILR
mgnify:CR=1 FL=1